MLLITYRHCLTKTCVFVYYLCDLFFHYHFIIFTFITINRMISLTQKNLFFGHICQKFNLRVLLRFCLILCQFQSDMAYDSVAYKQKTACSCNVLKKALIQVHSTGCMVCPWCRNSKSGTQARRNEKNWEGGADNYVILSATIVDRRRKFFISNCLKRLEKLNS